MPPMPALFDRAVQSVIHRSPNYFVLTVIGIALLTFFTWGVFGPEPS